MARSVVAHGHVILAFLVHQLLFFGAAILALNLLPAYSGNRYSTWHTAAPALIDASWRWDAQWYLSIATEGYRTASSGFQNVAFFPLYPWLMRALSLPWGEVAVPYAGALLSRLALLGALVYLYHLASFEYGRNVAARTVLYIAVYPTALFFSAAYSESLFLLTSVASFYHARRGQWWLAAGWGFLAALTRLQGTLLVIPLAYEFWRQGAWRDRQHSYRAAALGLVPAGLALFMLHLWLAVGDPLAFVHAQSAWSRAFAPPYETLISAVRIAVVGETDSTNYVFGILNTSAALFFLVASFWCLRRQRPSYGLYTLAALLIALSSPVPGMPTVSTARFTAVLFPVFLLLGAWGRNRYVHHTVLAVLPALFALLTALFVNWYWVV